MGLDLTEVAVDGSAHKAPSGGPGTGRNPTDRGKSGWKWSLLTDRAGIPVGWAADGANRHDQVLFEPTLATAADRGLLEDIETLHLDRGYDSAPVRACAADWGIDDIICARRRPRGTATHKTTTPLGLRWPSNGPTRGCLRAAPETGKQAKARQIRRWRQPRHD